MLNVLMGHRISNQRIDRVGPYQTLHFNCKHLGILLKSSLPIKAHNLIDSIRFASISKDQYTLLTVDDGFSGFQHEVLPILESFNMPCIIFLTTCFIDNKLLPYEVELADIIQSVDRIKTDGNHCYVFKSNRERQTFYEEVRQLLKFKSDSIRRRYLNELKTVNFIQNHIQKTNLFLSWKEILTLDKHPLISFGAHSVTHPSLKSIPWWIAFKEIVLSKSAIESKVGHRISLFSYPYGDHSGLLRLMIKLAGFKYAFTTRPQVLTADRFNPLALPRIDLQKFYSLSMSDD